MLFQLKTQYRQQRSSGRQRNINCPIFFSALKPVNLNVAPLPSSSADWEQWRTQRTVCSLRGTNWKRWGRPGLRELLLHNHLRSNMALIPNNSQICVLKIIYLDKKLTLPAIWQVSAHPDGGRRTSVTFSASPQRRIYLLRPPFLYMGVASGFQRKYCTVDAWRGNTQLFRTHKKLFVNTKSRFYLATFAKCDVFFNS